MITFTKPLKNIDVRNEDHEEFALKFKDKKCFSIIVFVKMLLDTLIDDPKHMKKTNILLVSKIREEALRQLNNKWFSHEELKTIQSKYNIPFWEDNQDNSGNLKFQNQIRDALIEAQIQVVMFQILEQHKESCRYATDENDEYIYNEEDENILLSKIEFDQKWDQKVLELCLPRSICEFDRNYSYMPEPFSHWDYRNFWQQFFFIEDEDGIYFIRGGSASSTQREYNGLFAHTFATLIEKYNHTISTDIYIYDEMNKFTQYTTFPNFKTLGLELCGNYQKTSKEIRESLFDGKLIQYNYNYQDKDFSLKTLEKNEYI